MASKEQLEAQAHAAERRADRINALKAERGQLAARAAGTEDAKAKAKLEDRVRQVDEQIAHFAGEPAGRQAPQRGRA